MKGKLLLLCLLAVQALVCNAQTVTANFSWLSGNSATSASSPPSVICSGQVTHTVTSSIGFKHVSAAGNPSYMIGMITPAYIYDPSPMIPVSITFSRPVCNLRIRICDLDGGQNEYLNAISPAYSGLTNVVGNFLNPGNNFTRVNSSIDDAKGWVEWDGPVTTLSFNYHRPGSGCGLIIDSLLFECCGPPCQAPNPGTSNTLSICSQGSATDLFPLLGSGAAVNGTWTNSAGTVVTMPYNPVTMNPGVYTYTVHESGCDSSASITVTEITPTVTAVPAPVMCAGMLNGSVSLSVSNAAEYALNGGTRTPIPTPFELTGLAAGPYQVEIFHPLGCTAAANFTISEINPAVAAGSVAAACYGMTNGSVSLTVSNATEYALNGGPNIPIPTPFEISGLASGSYQVQVFHPQGCTAMVNFTIPEINPAVTAVSTSAVCNGTTSGSVSLTASDATEYTLNGDPVTPIPTPFELNGLTAGSYQVQVFHPRGCTAIVSFTISEITTTLAAVPTGITCSGMLNGSVSLMAVNATEYTLNGGPNTPIPAPFELTGLAGGSHQVEVFHPEGCTATVNFTITEINPAVTAVPTAVTCHGMTNGSVSLTVSNATEYALNGGPNMPIPDPFELDGLAAGLYQVEVFHPEGCTATASFTITEPLPPTELMITSISPDLFICSADVSSITATGSGGTSPYTFTWFTEAGIVGTGETVQVTTSQTTEYGVILSDGCGALPDTAFMTIELVQPLSPVLLPDDPDGCFPHHVVFSNNTVSDGNILTSIIDFGDGTQPITTNALDTCSHAYEIPGTYTVQITSTSLVGCTYSNAFTDMILVYDNPEPGFTISPVPATMFETNVTLTNTSSPDVVSYSWIIEGGTPATSSSENVNVDFPKGIVANYEATLIVTDINGCVDSVTEVVRILSDVILYAPNTFTPDGDEFNQLWSVHIDGIDFYQFDLHVFDRWGELIWESHDPKSAWDGTYCGKIVPYGTYTWILTTGEFLSDKKYTFNGHINLIR